MTPSLTPLTLAVETSPATEEPACCRAPVGSGLISYFKRYKMEIELADIPLPTLPAEFSWVPWHDGLIEPHSAVLQAAFAREIDATVFASLSDVAGCRLLMNEIARKNSFIPQATWLVVERDRLCGTVQGLRERSGVGAIQNLGVIPGYRNRGLGRALLLQALHGFRQAGLKRTILEVTAQNERAQLLYKQLGFRRVKTLYKAVAVGTGL